MLPIDYNDSNFETATVSTSSPTVNDDSTAGYYAGAIWINSSTNTKYACQDAYPGSARWTALGTVTPTGGIAGQALLRSAYNTLYWGAGGSGGGGTGTVTSVNVVFPAGVSAAGGPVTTAGTITGSWESQLANLFLASPSGAAGAPAFRSIAVEDLPSLSGVYSVTGHTHSYVPYTGATTNLDMGFHHIILPTPTSANHGATKQYVDDHSGGGVSSVGLSLPAQFSVTGSPVTGSGTLGATWANQTQNYVFAGPYLGGAGAPSFRALVAGDIPDLSSLYVASSSLSAYIPWSSSGSFSVTGHTHSYLPYSGASADVQLGAYSLSATEVSATNVKGPTFTTSEFNLGGGAVQAGREAYVGYNSYIFGWSAIGSHNYRVYDTGLTRDGGAGIAKVINGGGALGIMRGATPSASADYTTKKYVDDAIAGATGSSGPVTGAIRISVPGAVSPASGDLRYYFWGLTTLVDAFVAANPGPVGSALSGVINVDGASAGTWSIADGATTGSYTFTGAGTGAYADTSYLTADVCGVGSTTPGSNLTFRIRYTV